MSTPQDQYLQVMQQGQDAILNAVSSWSKTVQDTAEALPTAPPQVNPAEVLDQVFDFAEKMLEMQRDFTKNLIARSAGLSEALASTTAQAAGDSAQQSSTVGNAAQSSGASRPSADGTGAPRS